MASEGKNILALITSLSSPEYSYNQCFFLINITAARIITKAIHAGSGTGSGGGTD